MDDGASFNLSVQPISGSAYRRAIGLMGIMRKSLTFLSELTSFAVPLFTVANGVVYVQLEMRGNS